MGTTAAHTVSGTVNVPVELVDVQATVRERVPQLLLLLHVDHSDVVYVTVAQGRELHIREAAGLSTAGMDAHWESATTSPLAMATQDTRRVDSPPPHSREQAPYSERTSHRCGSAHAAELHVCDSVAGVSVHLERSTDAPVRALRHSAERNCLPPPHDTEQLLYGE